MVAENLIFRAEAAFKMNCRLIILTPKMTEEKNYNLSPSLQGDLYAIYYNTAVLEIL